MPTISVLMSVYNEKENELIASVNSILEQSYSDFEFIIVCDNPTNNEICTLMKKIEKIDPRIKIIWNERNNGLALSLNHGFEKAVGEYIARMDADDISTIDRFEKQINFLRSNNCDLVWSAYEFIDEDDQVLDIPVRIYEKEMIPIVLPQMNIVHHPTVLMKKEAFQKAGMYRNYPCAQDYDLWLRMLYNGANMQMMNDVLLKYRVRSSSTTNRKKFQQICTLNYIRELYRQRCRSGTDNYSYERYLQYLEKQGVGNTKEEDAFFSANHLIQEGKNNFKNHQYFAGCGKYLRSFMRSKLYRKQFLLFVRRKIGGSAR